MGWDREWILWEWDDDWMRWRAPTHELDERFAVEMMWRVQMILWMD